MTARNLALEALYAGQEARTFSERLKAHALGRAAIAALEAETGEPAAWIDPRDLAVLACPGVKEFGPMRYAGVSGAQNSKATTPLYTAPPSAVPQWLPIETAPKTSKAILVHCAERKNTYTATWARDEEFPWSGKWKHFSGDFINQVATHWQPLPAAPGAPA